MRLNKVLHPEIVLGTRGSENLIRYYREILSCISYDGPGKWSIIPSDKGMSKFADQLDVNTREHMLLCWKFKKERPSVYYVPKDFVEVMENLDKEIPIDLLPKKWFGYIAFAEGALYDHDNEEIQGVYIYVGPPEETVLAPNEWNTSDRVVWISYVCKAKRGIDFLLNKRSDLPDHLKERLKKDYAANPDGFQVFLQGSTGSILVPTDFPNTCKLLMPISGCKLSDLIEAVPQLDFFGDYTSNGSEGGPDAVAKRNSVFRAMINTVLYINSTGADIQRVGSHLHVSLSKRKKLVQENRVPVANECSLPVTLVSWNYKKTIYHVDSTWVQSHQRWQRHKPDGPGGEWRVKLIWVAPHQRQYKNSEEAVAEEPEEVVE